MSKNEYKGKRILVTGGTGSIGSVIVKYLLTRDPLQVRVLSRDESKQFNLFHEVGNDKRLRLLIGDIRDKERVERAMDGVDIVFHAAAMKHVVACENDPYEAVKTNVLGTQNIIDCALAKGVAKVIGISTDKATDPVSVLGCTKLLAEKTMLASHFYKGARKTKFCFVRFGNVLSTRGSVEPLFYRQIMNGGPVTVTDKQMTRFFISVDEAISLVFKAAELMQDREIFILKMPIIRIHDLAKAMIELYAPRFKRDPKKVKIDLIGAKNGERTHEKLLSKDEAAYALETKDMFIIVPVIGLENPDYKEFSHLYGGAKRSPWQDYSTEGKKVLSVADIKKKLSADEDCLNRTLNLYL